MLARFFVKPLAVLIALSLSAADYQGLVKFGPVPVPGATVIAIQGEKRFTATTDPQGSFSFPDIAASAFKLEIFMPGFAPGTFDADATTPHEFALKMLSLDEMKAAVTAAPPPPLPAPAESGTPKPKETKPVEVSDLAQKAVDSMLINGSAINGAASIFGQGSAFGNNRRTGKSLYNASIGMILENGAFDAKPYSLTGQETPRPSFSRFQGLLSLGGPVKIPRLFRNGPNVVITYQWTRNTTVTTQDSLVPTLAQRTGAGLLPDSQISPQARSLLQYYPLPNFTSRDYNFQTSLKGATHDDNLQSRWQQRLPRRNQLSGNFAFQSTRVDSTSLFGFLDSTRTTGLNVGVNWLHSFNPRLYAILGVQFSRLSTDTDPFFTNRTNVSGDAGIEGNNQASLYWGPPALQFSSGIATLQDVQFSRYRNQTVGTSLEVGRNHGKHQATFGGDSRKQQWNGLYQQDPRGTFAFTGAATGNDFADFLRGVPDTSSIAYGNADKYLRAPSADAYFSDDWRAKPNLTITAGLRWEYSAPIHERYGRLVNLAITPDFTTANAVISPLLHSDVNNVSPRFAFALRPFGASSTVIRGGYGINYDTSVYQPIATQMAQQSPLSTSLRVQNTAVNPLTLANPFRTSSVTTTNTFAADPNFRVGYAQNFQLSAQRDLPKGLVILGQYLAIKGTRAQQQFLPNTYPIGAVNPCPACPTGFSYLTSNGNSIRHAGDLEIRRRLRNGLAVTAHYTYSKSIDDAALGGRNQGGPLIAQNWLNLSGERGLSYFDQRHLLTITSQYSSGMGAVGGTLMGGWRGRVLKEWTVTNKITVGSGMPLTPIYFAVVQGTGVTGSIRPDYTGASLYDDLPGLYLNPAAYRAPAPGQWGNAGRDSIIGPSQFNMISSLGRTFRAGDRWSLDFRIDSTNSLNHPVFPGYNTLVSSQQFGSLLPANPMRSLQATIRARF